MCVLAFACKPKRAEENSHFPPEVQIIFTNKCAVSGCHNSQSARNAANLDLSSWESLFRGSVNGSVAIPFVPLQSSLLQFVNTYDLLGLKASPTMPLNQPALSFDEVSSIRSWILQGCPDHHGVIPFSSDAATRGKAYITNQGCDLVSVVDAQAGMVMRYVKVGKDDGLIEQPHNVKVSDDGKYWYVCFSNGSWLQKFDAATDSLVGEVNITTGKWNVILLAPDGKTAFVSDLSNAGRIVMVDVQAMSVKQMFASGLFNNPHGLACSPGADTIYATAQYGNMIYRFIRSVPKVDQISLQKGAAPVLTPNLLDPHEILFDSDRKRYFITCQASNELRVMDAATDTLLAVVPLGAYPLEMALSAGTRRLFITCQEDANPVYPFFKGSVYVVDLNTLTVVKKIYEKFYQPHGIALDETRGLLYVSSTNSNPTGPAPHHASACAGRNGFFHILDLDTYEKIGVTAELSVFPYSLATRP